MLLNSANSCAEFQPNIDVRIVCSALYSGDDNYNETAIRLISFGCPRLETVATVAGLIDDRGNITLIIFHNVAIGLEEKWP